MDARLPAEVRAAGRSRSSTPTTTAVQAEFLPYLQALHPQVRAEDVAAFRVSRVRRVFAVPTLGYSASMPPTTTSIPGLQLIGSANLPFATLNVNDTLSLVEKLR